MPSEQSAFLRGVALEARSAWRSVIELVQAQALADTQALAVAHGSAQFTYGVIEGRSNRLANHLASLGVDPGAVVAMVLGHSVEFIIAALGILKAGAAYLPLDPADPAERLSGMVADAGARFLIADSRLQPELAAPCQTIYIEDLEQTPALSPSGAPRVSIKPSMLAYLIYTSGSTGKPKAVEITHGNLMNLVLWHQSAFDVRPGDRAPFMAAVGFDAAVWEIWPYLACGASLHLLADRSIYTMPRALADWLLQQRITISFVPTPLAEQMMRLDWPAGTPLRILLTGADTLHEYPSPMAPFKLVNNYGPTECTVVATSGTVEPAAPGGRLPSIGAPIANTKTYILDANLKPVPPGAIGELYIGGAGVAGGYRNDPELTAQKFIRDPFSRNPEDRLYRTGDCGYFLEDGRIAFAGRTDDQIKIRGRRIEMNEIVAALGRHPAIRASAVAPREDCAGSKSLVGYIVRNPESDLTPGALRKFLGTFLPEYMIPAIFVDVAELPLSSRGKVDRQALPVPDSRNTLRDEAPIPPRNELEAQLGAILADLLKTDDLGANDNFFFFGGDSLLGIQLIACMRQRFGVELPLRALIQAPTIASLSAEITRLRAGNIKPEERTAAD